MYIPWIKEYVKSLWRKNIEDVIFYHYGHSSFRAKKDYYQALKKNILQQNYAVYN